MISTTEDTEGTETLAAETAKSLAPLARNTKAIFGGGRLRRRAARPVLAPVGKHPRKNEPWPRPYWASASTDTKTALKFTKSLSVAGGPEVFVFRP